MARASGYPKCSRGLGCFPFPPSPYPAAVPGSETNGHTAQREQRPDMIRGWKLECNFMQSEWPFKLGDEGSSVLLVVY